MRLLFQKKITIINYVTIVALHLYNIVTCRATEIKYLGGHTVCCGHTEEVIIVNVIKVAATSRSTSVAGAIAGIIREKGRVDVQAIGAGAVNQAIKAIAIARGYLELDNIHIYCVPSFSEILIEGKERTAVRLAVESVAPCS